WAMHTCQESPLGPGNLNFATAKIVFKDGVGTEIGEAEEVIADANSPLGTWKETTVAATAPAGTATIEAYLLFIQPDSTQGGAVWVDDALLRQAVLVDAPDVRESPLGFDLRQNVPNPFAADTRIDFVLTRSAPVELSVYDVTGRRVRTLVNRSMSAGAHAAAWDGRAEDGSIVAAGVYQYVLRTPDGRLSRRMALLK
ncbi:MAG TPA: FlgD immunoglobulin-like domain containing protein, partial [bacterium]|nr:FlgD immunoglobulin-like domain containing protein [bacterium]